MTIGHALRRIELALDATAHHAQEASVGTLGHVCDAAPVSADFHAKRSGSCTPLSAASCLIPSNRHAGMESAVFQLDTVLGVSFSAAATLTVPPSSVMISDAVCIPGTLRNS